LHRFAGEAYPIVLTPPGASQRTDKALLLRVLGITAAEYASRFTYTVHTGWRLTCTASAPVCVISRTPTSNVK
jgi:hypothetical protein